MKANTWVIVAQRSRAKLLEYRTREKGLEPIEGFVNPAGELQTHELVSDKSGRGHAQSGGGGRYTLAPSEDAHEHALTVFAKSLARTIEAGFAKNLFEHLILVAEPHCLGKIKASLGKGAQLRLEAIEATVHKDLFMLDNKELLSRIDSILAEF